MNLKKIILSVCGMFLAVLLASCGSSGDAEAKKYAEEAIIGSASEKPEVISALSDIIYALTIDSIELPEFTNPEDALPLCRDSVLNYLLTTSYSRFSGSTATLEKAASEYPNMNITAAIGTADFEGMLYSIFNHGGNVRHSDTKRFQYLSKIEAYTPVVQTKACTYSLDIISIDETESTYRMTFYCQRGEEISPEYLAVFVKRENASCYINSLEKIASERITCNLTKTFS
ncbi:MAG: hypothetical protein ACI4QZ_05390 [Eubacteriales bacterium]